MDAVSPQVHEVHTRQVPLGERLLLGRRWPATQPESAAAVWNPKGYANVSWARVRLGVVPAG